MDIDPEFIPSLEKLLSDCVPSFEWIKDFEQNSPEDTHFTYYLFFGNKHNAPVGFAQISIEQNKSNKESFFKRLFNKSTDKIKKANWQMPGSLREGVIFEPMYSKMAIDKTQNIFNEFSLRDDIQLQSLRFSKAYAELSQTIGFNSNIKEEKLALDTLVKNQASYEEYLNSLNSTTTKKLKENWKQAYKNKFQFDEFSNLKAIFSYRKDQSDIYKKLKKDKEINTYLKENTQFLTIESNKKVLGIVFYIQGHGHHSFYDFINLSDLENCLLHQVAIMKFYELESANRLHFLNFQKDLELCAEMGFTTRQQIELSIIKSKI